MRYLLAFFAVLAIGCSGNDSNIDQTPLTPGPDAGTVSNPPPPPPPDAAVSTALGAAGAACATGAECAGGTCLGAAGQPEDGNTRFVGGYCTAIGCTPDTQNGCGPDEICVEGGDAERGGYCVELCSKADGLVCDRPDHVCLGLGTFGGCFSKSTVECNVQLRNCPDPNDICVRIGYEDKSLGRCETKCDPLVQDSCGTEHSCYYIRTYKEAFCGIAGTTPPEALCSCDKCCVDGYACTPDTDGVGRHCKKYCSVENPTQCESGATCVPLKVADDGSYTSPYGGCVSPGSAGTPGGPK